ncbi:MAG: branched-chain amino acid ABC transporter permease [Bacillota bacterium]
MKNNRLFKILVLICILVAAALYPIVVQRGYYQHLAVMGCIYSLLASSLNLIVGYTGQLSLGHAAFYGVGAYTSALLTLRLGWPVWAGMLGATVLAGVFGVLLGTPTLRLKGSYLVIATLGFGEIVRLVLLNWMSLTRGPMGLTGITRLAPWAVTKAHYFWVYFPIAVVVVMLLNQLVNSRTGRALKAIREDQVAAEVMGINLAFYKVLAFTVGAVIAGLAGSLYVHYVTFVSPDSFPVAESIQILVMVIVGGMGTIAGPIIGAFGIVFLLETMRALAEYRMVIYGITLFVVIVLMPDGLMGAVRRVSSILLQRGVRHAPAGD